MQSIRMRLRFMSFRRKYIKYGLVFNLNKKTARACSLFAIRKYKNRFIYF